MYTRVIIKKSNPSDPENLLKLSNSVKGAIIPLELGFILICPWEVSSSKDASVLLFVLLNMKDGSHNFLFSAR